MTVVVTGGIVIVVVSVTVVTLAEPSVVIVLATSRVVVRRGKVMVVAELNVLGGRTKMHGGTHCTSGSGSSQIVESTNTMLELVTEPFPAKSK